MDDQPPPGRSDYFEPGEDGVDGEDGVGGVVGVVGELGDVAAGGLSDGDADGVVRSPGFSPRRSERDSVQPAANVATSASAQKPESSFFISVIPSKGAWMRPASMQQAMCL